MRAMRQRAGSGDGGLQNSGQWSRGLRAALRVGLCASFFGLGGTGLLLTAALQAEAGQGSDPAAQAVGERAPGQGAAPSDPEFGGGPGVARFQLSPEQREKLRAAREAEVRKLLGLTPEAPLPRVEELTDAQKQTILEAREAELRRVLGLGPEAPLPNRESVTVEQRQRIAAAHEARIREALGLAPDAPLPLASPPPPPSASPASGDAGASK